MSPAQSAQRNACMFIVGSWNKKEITRSRSQKEQHPGFQRGSPTVVLTGPDDA